MEKSKPTRHESRREQELAAMLEEALSRPGVREAMAMYRRWQEADQSMEAYRTATLDPAGVLLVTPLQIVRTPPRGR